ncbi:MAG TPA: hypothetical protein PKD48_11765 [Sphingopyxis sp.]|nr:hypothetical protein [Sphingopyxis sp.]HMQ19848.1 hypothetical protein [Sphingopyxis sp.]
MKYLSILSTVILLSGCEMVSSVIDPDNYRGRADSSVWASKNDIIKAAKHCGMPDLEPRKAGDAWTIDSRKTKFGDPEKFDCLDRALAEQDLLVTR